MRDVCKIVGLTTYIFRSSSSLATVHRQLTRFRGRLGGLITQ